MPSEVPGWQNLPIADPNEPIRGWLPPQAPSARPVDARHAPPAVVTPVPGPSSALSVAALVLSVISLALLLITLGLSFAISLPLAAGGWVCAVRARREGRTGRNQTARVLGLIGIGLSVASMVVWLVLIASGFSIEGFQRDLKHELDRQRQSGR